MSLLASETTAITTTETGTVVHDLPLNGVIIEDIVDENENDNDNDIVDGSGRDDDHTVLTEDAADNGDLADQSKTSSSNAIPANVPRRPLLPICNDNIIRNYMQEQSIPIPERPAPEEMTAEQRRAILRARLRNAVKDQEKRRTGADMREYQEIAGDNAMMKKIVSAAKHGKMDAVAKAFNGDERVKKAVSRAVHEGVSDPKQIINDIQDRADQTNENITINPELFKSLQDNKTKKLEEEESAGSYSSSKRRGQNNKSKSGSKSNSK